MDVDWFVKRFVVGLAIALAMFVVRWAFYGGF